MINNMINNNFLIKYFVKQSQGLTKLFEGIHNTLFVIEKAIFCITVGAYAGKKQWFVYNHQQVEAMKCRSDISRKNLFFKNLILVFSCYYIMTARLCFYL